MSIATKKLPLAEADALAANICGLLMPACQRLEVAGSVRRRVAEVGDIEIVCIPKRKDDLFGGEADSELDALLGKLCKRYVTVEELTLLPLKGGDKYKQFSIRMRASDYLERCKLDLFITSPECWGVIFTIRTGPAEFSKRLVTKRQHGGLMPSHLQVREGRIWDSQGNPLETPEEANVFRACGLDWIPPEQR